MDGWMVGWMDGLSGESMTDEVREEGKGKDRREKESKQREERRGRREKAYVLCKCKSLNTVSI